MSRMTRMIELELPPEDMIANLAELTLELRLKLYPLLYLRGLLHSLPLSSTTLAMRRAVRMWAR